MWVYHSVKVIFKHHVAGYSPYITWSKNVCKLSRVVAACVVGRAWPWVAMHVHGVRNYKRKPKVRPCIAVQVLKIHLHLRRCQKMLVISYTCPGVTKALFERYSHNSVTFPMPTRGNSHLGLKVLGCQFCSYEPMIFCTVWSKAKYKISGKLPRDQPLLVSVVLSFVQLHLLLRLCLVSIHNVFGPHRDANFTAHPPKGFDCCQLLSRCIGKQTLAKA